MYRGFPAGLVSTLRCPTDAGTLHPQAGAVVRDDRITTGNLECQSCGRCYPIIQGILNMLDPDAMDEESNTERRARDEWADKPDEPTGHDDVAVHSHLSMLRPLAGVCLELGCGAGRFTTLFASRFAATLAVDFSGESLRVLAGRLAPEPVVGLVHADVTRLAVEPGRFDRCFSTLASNLPNREHRAAMFRLAAQALRPEGRFVFSTHHHCLRSRVKKIPQEGRYPGSGIYRYKFRRREILAEARPYFGSLRAVRRSIYLPSVLGRLGRVSTALAWLAERCPVADQLGELVIVAAERPLPGEVPQAIPPTSACANPPA